MFSFNLNSEINRSKSFDRRFALGAGLIILLTFSQLTCSEDSSSLMPEDFVFDATYYLVKISRTRDGVTFLELHSPSVAGVMEITGYNYFREVSLQGVQQVSEGIFSNQDGNLIFYSTTTEESKQGVYDFNNDWFTLNYTIENYLYTETWKRVEPLAAP